MKNLFILSLLFLSLEVSAQSRGDKEGGGKGGDGDFVERTIASSSAGAEIVISPEELAELQKKIAAQDAAIKKLESEAKQLRIENFTYKLKLSEAQANLTNCSIPTQTKEPRLPASIKGE